VHPLLMGWNRHFRGGYNIYIYNNNNNMFVALRLMPVARMPSFANGRLAESPDIRL